MHELKPEFGEHNTLRVVVETPRGSRHKYAWNEAIRAFELRFTLPSGMTWPYDYGFIPGTKGEDGDPLDVLVLMDEPTFAGCVLRVRLIGAFNVEKNGKRNDRYVACLLPGQEASLSTDGYRTIEDLPDQLLGEMESFLTMYSAQKGNQVRVLGRTGASRSIEAVKSAAG